MEISPMSKTNSKPKSKSTSKSNSKATNAAPAAAPESAIRNRVRELRQVRAGDLIPNPRNWRTHPEKQRAAVTGILSEIGYADALIAREMEDGNLQLIDGHLRAELDPDQIVPVLVLDVSASEADKLLLTLDPLTGLAGTNTDYLEELINEVQTGDQALAGLIADMAQTHGIIPSNRELNAESVDESEQEETGENDVEVTEQFQLIVDCENEDKQRELYEQLTGEGFTCRVVTI
jgi:hypothetical protein